VNTIGWLRRSCGIGIARPLAAIGLKREWAIAFRVVLGVMTAIALAVGPTWFGVGAALFLIALLLERSDGEFARIAGYASPTVNRFSLIAYSLTNSLAFAGLGIGLRDGKYGLWELVMGLFAAVALAVLPWLVKRLEAIDGQRSPEFDGIAGIDADDLLILVPVALWAGWAEGLLLVAAFGGSAFVAALYMTHFRKIHAK